MLNKRGLRQQKFREAEVPELARKIKSSRAWLNVQQMLKRSGKVCVPELFSGTEKTGSNNFNFADVTHLYQLYAAVERFKSESNGVIELEICALLRVLRPWPHNFIIVPKFIRRKADAFMQRDLHARQTHESDAYGEFKGSLYAVLRDSCGDKLKLDTALAELYPDQLKPVHSTTIHPGVNLNSQSAPAFVLLWLECSRMGFQQESERIRNLVKIIHDAHGQERIAKALFFAFMYCSDKEDLFTAFFSAHLESNKRRHNCIESESNYIDEQFFYQKQKISEYIDDINNRFLLNAYKRSLKKDDGR
ncbi:hypothetical protein [Lelliottia amnigena]